MFSVLDVTDENDDPTHVSAPSRGTAPSRRTDRQDRPIDAEAKRIAINIVMNERLRVMATYLNTIVAICSDGLPGMEERLQVVLRFAEHDAKTRQ